MTKYINAEKLKAEIKNLQCEQGFDTGEAESAYQFAIKDILSIIASLQQEWTTLTFDGFAEKVGTWFANLKLNKFRKTFDGDIFPATQLVQEYDWFVSELSKQYSENQEQPEVDLEKVIDGLTAGWIEGEEYGELQNINTHQCVALEEVKDVMCCMFELGLKAGKEK